MTGATADESPILWIAGVGWDDVIGTDRRLVTALSACRSVIWVDSPHRGQWRGWWRKRPPAVERISENVVRLRSPAPPGFSRRPVRGLTRFLQQWTIHRHVASSFAGTVVVASPVAVFPRLARAARVLYLTDDWVTGADLMGLDRSWVKRSVAANLTHSHAAATVSPGLADSVRQLSAGLDVSVVPNGAPVIDVVPGVREPVAGVIGQLNERIDVTLLHAVAASGVRLRLIGPRTDSDPRFGAQLDALMARDNVEWTGALDMAGVADQLSRIRVGLTPYADSRFNSASFPLKTLEYLAAGVPVVSTDLAASRWLATRHVEVAVSSADFVQRVQRLVATAPESHDELDRIAVAGAHTWSHRVTDMITVITKAEAAAASS